MDDVNATPTKFVNFVPRRQILRRAMALVGATLGLATCKHFPVGTGPVGQRESEGDGGDGGGGSSSSGDGY